MSGIGSRPNHRRDFLRATYGSRHHRRRRPGRRALLYDLRPLPRPRDLSISVACVSPRRSRSAWETAIATLVRGESRTTHQYASALEHIPLEGGLRDPGNCSPTGTVLTMRRRRHNQGNRRADRGWVEEGAVSMLAGSPTRRRHRKSSRSPSRRGRHRGGACSTHSLPWVGRGSIDSPYDEKARTSFTSNRRHYCHNRHLKIC